VEVKRMEEFERVENCGLHALVEAGFIGPETSSGSVDMSENTQRYPVQ
jgi:hypothetical protein